MPALGPDASPPDGPDMLPLVIVPGFCSSGLEVEKSTLYPSWEGCRAWLGLSRLGFQSMHGKGIFDTDADKSLKNKWLEHLVLKGPAQEHEGIHLKAIEGVEGVKFLDPDFCFGVAAEATFVFAPVIKALEGMGYQEGSNLAAASYDWRFAPAALQQREAYFDKLMRIVESLDRRGTGVVLLGHSMGNKTVAYFLQYVRRRPDGAAWLERHVYSWIAAGAPHLGAPQAFRCTLLGDKFGLDAFVTDSEAVVFARSLSASPWLFPLGATERPLAYLRRGGLLEVRNLSACIPHCGLQSSRNSVMLSVEVWWGEGDDTECLTTKSSTDFAGGVAQFDPDSNFMRFGGGPPELPWNATISVIVKEKGIKDDTRAGVLRRLGKGLIAGVQLIDEAAHGRKGMGVPKANTQSVALAQALKGSRQRDGFVELRLPVASVRELPLFRRRAEDYSRDYVSLQVRWLDYRALRQEWLGVQDFAPPPRRPPGAAGPPLVRRAGRPEAVYDAVEMRQMAQMEAPDVLKVFRDYYEADSLYDHTGLGDCPPIGRVVAVHGVNVPTEVAYAFRARTARLKPTTVHTRFALDEEAELAQGAASGLKLEGGIVWEQAAEGEVSGDGVVPLSSMDHCKDWSGRLDLKVIHLDGAEHRAMLADPRFHLALREALTTEPRSGPGPNSSSSSSAPAGPRKRPQKDYSIAGTWNDWAPQKMEWDGKSFFHIVKISKQGWESFQILLDASWDKVLYPSVKSANPSVEHQLLGPDDKNKGLDWTIGRPGFNPFGVGAIRAGTEYKVVLEVDDRGLALCVSWDLHLSVQLFAKAEVAKEQTCRWQAAKSETEWWDCPEDVSQQLSAAQAAGLRKVRLRIRHDDYEVDLHRMVQRNLQTGRERAIRVVTA